MRSASLDKVTYDCNIDFWNRVLAGFWFVSGLYTLKILTYVQVDLFLLLENYKCLSVKYADKILNMFVNICNVGLGIFWFFLSTRFFVQR